MRWCHSVCTWWYVYWTAHRHAIVIECRVLCPMTTTARCHPSRDGTRVEPCHVDDMLLVLLLLLRRHGTDRHCLEQVLVVKPNSS